MLAAWVAWVGFWERNERRIRPTYQSPSVLRAKVDRLDPRPHQVKCSRRPVAGDMQFKRPQSPKEVRRSVLRLFMKCLPLDTYYNVKCCYICTALFVIFRSWSIEIVHRPLTTINLVCTAVSKTNNQLSLDWSALHCAIYHFLVLSLDWIVRPLTTAVDMQCRAYDNSLSLSLRVGRHAATSFDL